jgi:aspartokinase-like uncharacterized kinase
VSKTSIPWVIKFGGSLSRSASLGAWLHALSETPCVIVPGGGPFADAVRETQKQQGFNDTLAHALAIRAMGLYGQMLGGMQPRLMLIKRVNDLAEKRDDAAPLLWLPDPEETCLRDLKASWEITSDSIAALLALELGVPQLLLVKSKESKPGEERLTSAIRKGLVDPCLRGIVAGHPLKLWFTGPSNPEGLAKGLQDPVSCFTQLTA